LLLLTSVDKFEDAERIRQLFFASGIPLFIENDYTRSFPSITKATFGYRVHVFLDEQVEDAKMLLSDPNFEVANPVNCSEFFEKLEHADSVNNNRFSLRAEEALTWLLLLSIVGILAWIAWKFL
jgi:hypothetical protein